MTKQSRSPSIAVPALTLALVGTLSLAGCATTTPAAPAPSAVGYCQPPVPYRYNPAFAPKAEATGELEAALTPDLLARYPRRGLLAANAVGLLPALQTLTSLDATARQDPTPAHRLAALEQRQRILAQVAVVASTIDSLAAELDCEGERADQQAGRLAELDGATTQRLTVLSILVGAVGGAGATVAEHRHAQLAFGVGGGLAAAALSLLTLSQGHHTTDFPHPRNLLQDVWNETPSSTVWPPSVWTLMTSPAFSNEGRHSLVHNTRARWLDAGQLGAPGSDERRQRVGLLFGAGGAYTAEQLAARANLLNELQATVRLLDQELQGVLLMLDDPAGAAPP